MELVFVSWMGKAERLGMEMQSGFHSRPIEAISQYGQPKSFWMGAVQTQLVSSAAVRGECHSSDKPPVVQSLYCEALIACGAPFALQFVVDLVGSIFHIEAEREGDDSRF